MSNPKAYIFDVFGTLVDWRESVAKQAKVVFSERGIAADPHAFADYWRGRYQPGMERIRSGNRGYVALDVLHLENLTETLEHFDIADQFDDAARHEMNTMWEKLDPWPDVVEGLAALKKRDIIAPCSNGSIALMTRLAKYAGLPWDCILGADIAQNYKPQTEVYHACCNALRLEPGDVMMVAAHNDDLEAARACGLQTGFTPRVSEYGPYQSKDFEPTSDWDWIGEKLMALADK